MSSDHPSIEVFIPVFNDVKNIERAVMSCLDQKSVELRVIVSDNKSIDGTFEILSKIAAVQPNLIVHQNPENIGMMRNINRYKELVSSPYYMLLCSDDYLCNEMAMLKALTMIDNDEDIQSVFCNIRFEDDNGAKFATNIFNRGRIFDPTAAFRQSIVTLRNKFGIPLLHRTIIGQKFSFPLDGTYTADFWQSYKIGSHGVCGHIDEVMIANTYTGKNATFSVMYDVLEQTKALQKKEGIELTQSERFRQLFNYVFVTMQKMVAFKILLPILKLIKFGKPRQ